MGPLFRCLERLSSDHDIGHEVFVVYMIPKGENAILLPSPFEIGRKRFPRSEGGLVQAFAAMLRHDVLGKQLAPKWQLHLPDGTGLIRYLANNLAGKA